MILNLKEAGAQALHEKYEFVALSLWLIKTVCAKIIMGLKGLNNGPHISLHAHLINQVWLRPEGCEHQLSV